MAAAPSFFRLRHGGHRDRALTLLRPGTTVALAAGAYYGTGSLLTHLDRWGV